MLAETVREAARRFGDAPALVPERGRPVSFAELDRRSSRVAAGLGAASVLAGDLVALVMPSGVEYVVAYAAIAKLGGVTVGVNPRLTPMERGAALAAVVPDHVMTTSRDAAGIPTGIPVMHGLPEGDAHTTELRPPEPEAPHSIVLTSGTTGTPRGAVFTATQLRTISTMDWGNRWGGGSPQLVATEMAHIGFMTKLPWYLRCGGRMHLLERWTPAAALAIIAREGIPVVGGIAAQIAMLIREPTFDDHDLSEVALVVAGGGPSAPALVREARRRFGAGYSIRYSSTESGGMGTMTDPGSDDPGEIASVGRPREGIDLEIRREGEVWLRSPTMMSGYHRDPSATASTIVDGWLRTGDAGELDPWGRLRLVGRTSERYRRGGYFVYPAEVEAILQEHPGVRQIAITPRPDEVMGETGIAVLVPANHGSPPSVEDLRGFARDRLASFKLPEDVRVVDELPYTSLHKLDRRRLAQSIASTGRSV